MVTPPIDRSLPVRGAIAAVGSIVCNVGLVFAAGALGIAPGFRALTVPPVAFLSAVGALGATLVYWVLTRIDTDAVGRPARTFRRLAAGVLVVSFLPDIALLWADPTATLPGVFVLMLMHVVVAAISVGLLVGRGA